jgi:hypothetical protein
VLKHLLFLSFSCLFSLTVSGQRKTLEVRQTDEQIVIDGQLDEALWQTIAVGTDFQQYFPFDTIRAITQTEFQVAFDDQFVYVAGTCYRSDDKDFVIPSRKRDFEWHSSEAVMFILDPFNDHVNGFSFAVNPIGVLSEGLLANSGGFGAELFWDNKWFAEAKIYGDRWTFEMAIPFKTLRFDPNFKNWGCNLLRADMNAPEGSAWSRVMRTFEPTSLAFTGELQFVDPLPKPSRNMAFIPSANLRYGQEREDTLYDFVRPQTSVDAKIAISSSLNLDITFNPDFSQVDVDRQVTNLTRFSILFPERRNFFLENSDLFARYGFRQIRPFFSRRIGLAEGEPVPILAGARLSGRVDENWRIGLMTMQTEGVADLQQASTNYSVAAVQRRVFGNNNLSAIVVNRQGFDNSGAISGDYNRIVGLDYDIYTKGNKLRGKLFYHRSIQPNIHENAHAHASWLLYRTNKIQVMWNHEYVGRNYQADMGFVRRNVMYDPIRDQNIKVTYWRLEPRIKYFWNPNGKIINQHGPGIYLDQYFNNALKTTDRLIRLSYEFTFQNTSFLRISNEEKFTRLIFPADVTFAGNPELPRGTYSYRDVGIYWESDSRRLLALSLEGDYGSYYVGKRRRVGGSLRYRAQPWGNFSINYNRNIILMPDPYVDQNLDLLGASVELSFTKSLFFTTFFQYNNQGDNFGSNIRLQWRFAPMSDLFIVYTDNYYLDFQDKNRALVLKLTYWLNS